MKFKILIIFFLLSTIGLLIPIVQDNSEELSRIATYGLLFMSIVWFLIFFMVAISSISKKKHTDAILYFIIAFIFPILFAKISFYYYNLYYHLIYLIIFIALLFLIKNQKVDKFLIGSCLFIGISSILVNDNSIFKMLHSKNIAWSENFLKWEMFKDNRDKYLDFNYTTFSKGEIYSELGKDIPGIATNSIRYKINVFGNKPAVIAIAFFVPSESYYNENYKTNQQLKHHQLYVDICELYTRKIRAIFNDKDLGSIDYKKEFLRFGIEYDEIQSPEMKASQLIEGIIEIKNEVNSNLLYETKNGRNSLELKKWESEIKKKLLSLDKYRI